MNVSLRLLAHFTQEPALLKAFELDEDIHRAVAAEVFAVSLEQVTREQRGYAKTINFGIIYGVSAFGLADRIQGLSVQAAGELIRKNTVDHAMAFEPGLIFERFRHNIDPVMSLPALPMACMARMLVGFVIDLETLRR